jgi:hypothetical protein
VKSRRAILAGLAAMLAYAGGAALSGHLSLTTRGPLLDGFYVPPPYRWVKPQPALAAGNKKPASLRATVALNPQTGSEANVWTTADAQASLGLDTGAIPPLPGQASVKLTIAPLAPRQSLTLPAGMSLVGNVYRVAMTYQPSGKDIAKFAKPGVLVLAYPAPPNAASYSHVMMTSGDGTTWTALGGTDSTGQLVVQQEVAGPGLFAIGQSKRGGPPKKSSGARGILDIVLIVAAAAVVLFTVVIEIRHRARKRRGQAERW